MRVDYRWFFTRYRFMFTHPTIWIGVGPDPRCQVGWVVSQGLQNNVYNGSSSPSVCLLDYLSRPTCTSQNGSRPIIEFEFVPFSDAFAPHNFPWLIAHREKSCACTLDCF
jgi:hypothetical protein